MSKTNFIYCSASSDQQFTDWKKPEAGKKVARPAVAGISVVIRGKANVMNPKTMTVLTPHGAVTEVDDETLAFLESNKHFKDMEKRGFIKVSKGAKLSERQVNDDIVERDESSPLTPDDYKEAKESTEKAIEGPKKKTRKPRKNMAKSTAKPEDAE